MDGMDWMDEMDRMDASAATPVATDLGIALTPLGR